MKSMEEEIMCNDISLRLKEKIFPIYKDLLEKGNFSEDDCIFAAQWGKNYPPENNPRLLFVGKSVNGWIKINANIDSLFDKNNNNRIFDRSDQIEWVHNSWGNKDGYNTKRSAFWRLIVKVAETFYSDDWYKKIAWSNLYKIAPKSGGNPSDKFQSLQREDCVKLLKEEIKVLAPEYVIMLTSGWEAPFIEDIKKGKEFKFINSYKWNKYQTTLIEIDKVKYIISCHPQGKNEREHKRAIIELMQVW